MASLGGKGGVVGEEGEGGSAVSGEGGAPLVPAKVAAVHPDGLARLLDGCTTGGS